MILIPNNVEHVQLQPSFGIDPRHSIISILYSFHNVLRRCRVLCTRYYRFSVFLSGTVRYSNGGEAMTFAIAPPIEARANLRGEAPVPFFPESTAATFQNSAGNGDNVDELSQGISAYRALRSFAEEILATSDLERMLERCGLLVQRLLRADACSIALLDERSGQLIPLLTMASGRTTTIAPLPFDLLDGRMRDAIYADRSLIVAHGQVLDGSTSLPLAEMQLALAAMLIPLPLEQRQRGIFWVGRIHGEPFTREEQELAETLSALIALGVRATELVGH
jgi:hypothetical protein